jgi:hypothetical protein
MHGWAIAGDALRSAADAFADGAAAAKATAVDVLGTGAVSTVGRAHALASNTSQAPVTAVPGNWQVPMAELCAAHAPPCNLPMTVAGVRRWPAVRRQANFRQ